MENEGFWLQGERFLLPKALKEASICGIRCDDRREGLWTLYDLTVHVMYTVHFLHGSPDGPCSFFGPRGQLNERFNFGHLGKLEGP